MKAINRCRKTKNLGNLGRGISGFLKTSKRKENGGMSREGQERLICVSYAKVICADKISMEIVAISGFFSTGKRKEKKRKWRNECGGTGEINLRLLIEDNLCIFVERRVLLLLLLLLFVTCQDRWWVRRGREGEGKSGSRERY